MGQFKENLHDYLASEEGRDFMKKIMKDLLVDVLTAQQKIAAEERR